MAFEVSVLRIWANDSRAIVTALSKFTGGSTLFCIPNAVVANAMASFWSLCVRDVAAASRLSAEAYSADCLAPAASSMLTALLVRSLVCVYSPNKKWV
ncbi:unknown [Bacteroides sp. CAG:927]|nr:unknown [Bacteroides sp. CAG:927]